MLDQELNFTQMAAQSGRETYFWQSGSVFISGEIDDKLAARVGKELIALAEASDNPINLYIS